MQSSFHFFLDHRNARHVYATLEVLNPPPAGDGLVFWALQTSVHNRLGRRVAGVHLGLQHHPNMPGRRAANFGGYTSRGRELDGSTSPLPSSIHNVNTRDFPWQPHRPYRLAIHVARNAVIGLVDDEPIRRLYVPGAVTLRHSVVWTEDFRPCDAAAVRVRWTGLATNKGPVRTAMLGYQPDGCGNTNTSVDPATGAVVQSTSTYRSGRPNTRVRLP